MLNSLKIEKKFKKRKKLAMEKNLELKIIADKKLKIIKKFVSFNTHYKKLKYKNIIYTIGDHVLIKTNTDFFIAKITRIVPLNGIMKYRYWPTIEIN